MIESLLVLRLDVLDAGSHLGVLAEVIQKPSVHSLDILLCARVLTFGRQRAYFVAIQQVLGRLYLESARLAQKANKTLDIHVIVDGFCGYAVEKEGYTHVYASTTDAGLLERFHTTKTLCSAITSKQKEVPTDDGLPQSYACVAVGGTFDHLHTGHKILLSMTAWLASERVICGITDDALLQNKKHKDLLEPLADRRAGVEAFYRRFKRGLAYDLPAINDVYGPTGHMDAIDALVASRETASGGAMIEAERARKGLRRLDFYYIAVIGAEGEVTAEGDGMQALKLSSSAIREQLARNRKL